jgi:hypothetical protein
VGSFAGILGTEVEDSYLARVHHTGSGQPVPRPTDWLGIQRQGERYFYWGGTVLYRTNTA